MSKARFASEINPLARELSIDASPAGGLYLIPHHRDFGFYSIDKQFCSDESKNDLSKNAFPFLPSLAELKQGGVQFSIFTKIQQRINQARKALLFDEESDSEIRLVNELLSQKVAIDIQANGSSESIACFFIELLWEAARNKENDGWDFGEKNTEIDIVLQTIYELRNEIHIGNELAVRQGISADELSPVVRRDWISSFYHENETADTFSWIRGPKIASGNWVSIKGDWYLAIPTGSPDPLRGIQTIRELVSYEAGEKVMQYHIGISPRVDLRRSHRLPGISVTSYSLYLQSKSRRSIKGYRYFKRVLMSLWNKSYRLPEYASDPVGPAITEFKQKANKILNNG